MEEVGVWRFLKSPARRDTSNPRFSCSRTKKEQAERRENTTFGP
jgi:hypothetical protein